MQNKLFLQGTIYTIAKLKKKNYKRGNCYIAKPSRTTPIRKGEKTCYCITLLSIIFWNNYGQMPDYS